MQPTEPGTTQYHFEIFADFRQVYLQDCQVRDDLTHVEGRDSQTRAEDISAWVDALLTPEARARRLGVAYGTLCILTARNYTVPVEVEVRSGPPTKPVPEDVARWDHVVEASLDLPSGCLIVKGVMEDLNLPHIAVAPGTFRVRVYYGGIYTVSEDRLKGKDHYRVVLWPVSSSIASPFVLHSQAAGIW